MGKLALYHQCARTDHPVLAVRDDQHDVRVASAAQVLTSSVPFVPREDPYVLQVGVAIVEILPLQRAYFVAWREPALNIRGDCDICERFIAWRKFSCLIWRAADAVVEARSADRSSEL